MPLIARAIGTPREIPQTPRTPDQPSQKNERNIHPSKTTQGSLMRHKLIAAMLALGITTCTTNAHGEEPKSSAVHAAQEENDSTLKAGMYLSPGTHNTFGGEISYTFKPFGNAFVLTPANVGLYRFYPENIDGDQKSSGYKTKFFLGTLIGFSHAFDETLEAEVSAGGGLALQPAGQETLAKGEAQLKFTAVSKKVAPILGVSVEVPVVSPEDKPTPQVGGYIGVGF